MDGVNTPFIATASTRNIQRLFQYYFKQELYKFMKMSDLIELNIIFQHMKQNHLPWVAVVFVSLLLAGVT